MKVTKGTILRTIALAATLAALDVFSLAMLVVMAKVNLITDVAAAGYATTLVAANISAVTAWWKNNSFTSAALESDEVLATIRALDREGDDEDDTYTE